MAPVTSKPWGYVKVKVQPPVSTKKAKQKVAKPSTTSSKKLFKGNGVLKLCRFTVDCTLATDTNVMDVKDFQKFLGERVESKMDNTGDNTGNFVVVKFKKSKITVTSGPPFSEKMFESLITKYLKRKEMQFKVVPKGPHLFQLTKKGIGNREEDED